MSDDHHVQGEANVPNGNPPPRRYSALPPPPAEAPGWLSHIPTLQPDQFPRAPTTFAFGADLSSATNEAPGSLRSSSSFHEYLQQHLPTYAPGTDLRRQHQREPLPKVTGNHLPPLAPLSSSHPTPAALVGPSALIDPFGQTTPALNIGPRLFQPSNLSFAHSESLRQPDLLSQRLPPSPQDVEYVIDLPRQDLLDPRLRLPTDGVRLSPAGTISAADRDDNQANSIQTRPYRKRGFEESTLVEDVTRNQLQSLPKRARNDIIEEIAVTGMHSEPLVRTDKPGTKPKKDARARGRPKGQKAGPKPVLDPGPEFMKLYNQAMDAFIEDNDVVTAQTKVLEAIGINPEIFAAHSLLADIHFANNDHEKALDALIGGLHAHMNDVELWRQVADTILSNQGEAPQIRLERAMYCFGGILKKEPMDMDARFQRAECARLLGQVTRAFKDLNILLQDDPHNSTVLAQFTKLCSDVDDAPKAKLLYDEHFEYYRINGISEEDCFTWQDIGVYVDLIVQTGDTAQAIVVLKRLSRWLCGRLDEFFWEEYLEDDREFDQNHYPRRLEVDLFDPDKYPEREYGEALPLDVRAKLGILRLKLNYREEAQSHFDWLEPDLESEESLVEEYCDTFLEVAKSLNDAKEHKEALRFYNALEDAGVELGFDFWIGLGASSYVCDQKEKALRAYSRAMEVNPQSVEARTQIAKLYRDLGDRTNALKYGREAVLMSQDAIPQTGNRKYENKENRLLREAAERALRGAYRLPRKPHGAPGKVPDSLKYRTRMKSRFMKYVPRQTEELQSDSGGEDAVVRTKGGRPKKFGPPNRPGRRKKASKEDQNSQDPEKATETLDGTVIQPANTYVEDVTSPSTPVENREESIPTRLESKSAEPELASTLRTKRAPRRPKKALNKLDPQKHYEELQTLYRTLLNHQNAMREGDAEATGQWVDCAQAMVDDFRTVRVFFPGERHKKFDGYTAPIVTLQSPSEAQDDTGQTPSLQQSIRESTSDVTPANTVAEPRKSARMVDKGVPNHYCDISFSEWLDIFLELALIIANSTTNFRTSEHDLQTDCYSIINAALDCNVFHHHHKSLTQIYTVYLSCCLALNDDVTLYNTVLRWFMNEYAFCTDTYRLYSAVALVGEYTNLQGKSRVEGTMYRDNSNQKYLFRQLCSIDQQLPKNYGEGSLHGPVPAFMRRERDGLRRQMGDDDNDDLQAQDTALPQSPSMHVSVESTPHVDQGSSISHSKPTPVGSVPRRNRLENPVGIRRFSPKEMDVVLFVLYAHLMMANNSFSNALNYLYRAHTLDPTNTVCLLSMAFCYLTELFKRQVGNRHALSLMGWVWFGRYEEERRKQAKRIDEQHEMNGDFEDHRHNASGGKTKMIDIVNREIEFNRARCWDMLGMADLAVRGYKKMLSLPNPGKDKVEEEVRDNIETNEEEDEDGPESYDMEAAYALSKIYMINGDGQRAKEIAEKYMVVE